MRPDDPRPLPSHRAGPRDDRRLRYVDDELEEARARLSAALAWARAAGIDAAGHVGDPNAALGAIEDVLRTFGADEVIISTHPPGKSNWLETGIVDRLREELDIPVQHIVVDLERTGSAAPPMRRSDSGL